MPYGKLSIGLMLILALTLSSCTFVEPGHAINEKDLPKDFLQAIKANVEQIIPEIDWDNGSIRWVDFNKDYYLIELESENGVFNYVWADKQGIEFRCAVTSHMNPHLEKCENGEAWFLCTQSDPWTAFPYYLVAKPDSSKVEERPWFKTPTGVQYVIGSSDMDYHCVGWTGGAEGIDIRFAYSLSTESGVESTNIHPPKTTITESGNQVTFRFEDVSWPKMTGEEIAARTPWQGMGFDGALLTDIIRGDDHIELSFEYPGSYSYLMVEDGSNGYITMAIRFGLPPDTPELEIYDPVEPGIHFAYVDEQNRIALNTLFLTYPLWVSGYVCPQNTELALSPDGNTIAYVFWDAMSTRWYLVLLDVDSKNETFIEIGSMSWYFDMGAGIRWEPSQQYVSIEDYCDPPCPFTIVDVQAKEVLFTCMSTGSPLWSPDCSKAAYEEIEGKCTVVDSEAQFTSKLAVYDVYSGETTILVEGERGYHITPERWTEQGAIVYRYINSVTSEKLMLDTEGGIYDYPEESSEDIESTLAIPPGFPEDLGTICATDEHCITGEWLIAVLTADGTTWIYHYTEGEIPTRLVPGRDPMWLRDPVITPVPDIDEEIDTETNLCKSGSVTESETSIYMLGSGDGWALTDTGILRTTDGGEQWNNVTPLAGDLANQSYPGFGQFYALDPQTAWLAYGSVSEPRVVLVFHTNDGGSTWIKSTIEYPDHVLFVISISFSDETHGSLLVNCDGIALGNEAVILYTTNDSGVTWTQTAQAGPDSTHPNGLPFWGIKSGASFADVDCGWITGRWSFKGVWLYGTSDGGETWDYKGLPVPDGYSTQGGSIDTLQPLFFGIEGILPVVFHTEHSIIFYTTVDGGMTWEATTPVSSSLNSYNFSWCFLGPSYGWVSDGTRIIYTSDGAETWTELNSDEVLESLLQSGFSIKQLNFTGTKTGWVLLCNNSSEDKSCHLLKTIDGGWSWIDCPFPVGAS